jgi:lysozyme family protein
LHALEEEILADFNAAIPIVLQHEGGYSKNPADPGGETNFGISKRSYPNVDIAGLTQAAACDIYRHDFWGPLHLDSVNNQQVATKILDTCVNLGLGGGVKYLQRALGASGTSVMVDGQMGPTPWQRSMRPTRTNSLLLTGMCWWRITRGWRRQNRGTPSF